MDIGSVRLGRISTLAEEQRGTAGQRIMVMDEPRLRLRTSVTWVGVTVGLLWDAELGRFGSAGSIGHT